MCAAAGTSHVVRDVQTRSLVGVGATGCHSACRRQVVGPIWRLPPFSPSRMEPPRITTLLPAVRVTRCRTTGCSTRARSGNLGKELKLHPVMLRNHGDPLGPCQQLYVFLQSVTHLPGLVPPQPWRCSSQGHAGSNAQSEQVRSCFGPAARDCHCVDVHVVCNLHSRSAKRFKGTVSYSVGSSTAQTRAFLHSRSDVVVGAFV